MSRAAKTGSTNKLERTRRSIGHVAVAQNYPSATCGPVTAHWLRVYPPGSTVAGYAGYTFSACSRTGAPLLTVLPVRPGKGAANVTP
jgi:hypothetical protein